MPRLTRQEKQAQTRAELVDAATQVFARRGFAAASVEEIADAAGFSHGAVYSNFSSKEELFLAVYRERILRRQVEILETHNEAQTPTQGAAKAADQWMARVGADPEYFLLFLEFVLHAGRHEEVAAAFADAPRATRRTIAALIEQRGDDAHPLDPDELALAIRALGLGLAIESLLDRDGIRPELYGEVVRLLLAERG